MYGPTWLVVGARANYWAVKAPDALDTSGWSWWSSEAPVQISWANGPFLLVQAGAPGTATLSVSAFAADTARKVVTVLSRPMVATPMEQAPITATSFRVLEEKTGDSFNYYTALVDVAPRASGDLWILEATIDLPGVSLPSRCATNRRVGQGGPLLGEYYGDPEVWLHSDSTYHVIGNPTLHLMVMDASGHVTQVSLTGTLVPYDYTLLPPTRYADPENAWTCS